MTDLTKLAVSLSEAQRNLVMKLTGDWQPITRRETTSVLCLTEVQIAPCIYAKLAYHQFGRGHSVPATAKLSSLGVKVRRHLQDQEKNRVILSPQCKAGG